MAIRWLQTLDWGSFPWPLPPQPLTPHIPPPTMLLQGHAAPQLSTGAKGTVPEAGEAHAGSS